MYAATVQLTIYVSTTPAADIVCSFWAFGHQMNKKLSIKYIIIISHEITEGKKGKMSRRKREPKVVELIVVLLNEIIKKNSSEQLVRKR